MLFSYESSACIKDDLKAAVCSIALCIHGNAPVPQMGRVEEGSARFSSARPGLPRTLGCPLNYSEGSRERAERGLKRFLYLPRGRRQGKQRRGEERRTECVVVVVGGDARGN